MIGVVDFGRRKGGILTRLIPLTAKEASFNGGFPCLHAAWKAQDSIPDLIRLMQGLISVFIFSIGEEGRSLSA